MSERAMKWRIGRESGASQLRPEIPILLDITFVAGLEPTTYDFGRISYPTTTGNTVGASERRANAELVTEALNVKHELNLTPRQLAEQRAELIEALRVIRETLVCTKLAPLAYDANHHCDQCGSSTDYAKDVADAAIAKCGVKP